MSQDQCKTHLIGRLHIALAFDVMPRSKLQEAMDLAKVDPVATLDTDNGIRQGCCLAPSLWVLYTGLILTYIKQKVSMHDSTVFADDFLFHWLVDSTDQLKGAFNHISFVLDTLAAFGMTISPGKSAVLIGVRGSKVGSILQKHVFKDPRKGKFLHCPTRHGTTRLPVVTQHPYLGAILSYQSMEALTLKERVRQSWSSFHRILPALRSNSVALRSRISVWQSCVFSTLMHGLDSVGLAPGGSIPQTLCASVYSDPIVSTNPEAAPEETIPLTPTGAPLRWLVIGYLSRHVKSQHAEAYIFHAAVLKWLDDRKTAILSPCQFCGADFKAMETHMKDALRKEMADVETQELMGAQEQANLLSAMMQRSAGALEPSAPSDPGMASTRASTPVGEGAATEAAPEGPEPMETQRDKRTAEDRHDRSDRKWKSDTDRDKELMNLCLSMGRLLLRHEDQFGINRAQDNYVMFAQCQGVLSMVPELYVAAEAWKTMKKETPELLTLPLRAWLLKHWVDLMLKRMEMIMTSEETIKQAKDMLILDDQCNVPYLEWNRSSRSLQIKKDRDPMTLSQVLEALKAMQLLAIQPLVVPLMLQVGSRTAECHQMWNHLQRLSHSAACRVTAVSLRSDRMGRSALGVAVQKIIEEMY
ncbi:unnamed protein product, partial [Symbiodinium necroappetens]